LVGVALARGLFASAEGRWGAQSARRLYLPITRGGSGLPAPTPTSTTPPTIIPPTATPTPTSTVTPTPISKARVVQIHAPQATSWDYVSGWYGSYVAQNVVNQMVEQGLMRLTGTSLVSGAWAALMPLYKPGQKIAIKINLNNTSCHDGDNVIDALVEPVNALIGSLVAAGIREEDVWVYDASRSMPERFYNRRQYKQARYLAASCADERATFDHVDPSLRVSFSHPAMVTPRWLTDVLYRAAYVINMPILKRHGTHPVTLGFKNHFGSLNYLGGDGRDDDPHIYISPGDGRYSADFSPLVDINANPNIANKTVLTLGDGLYGAYWVNAAPQRWQTFENSSPNSLFFSRDPVAIDCVMCDLLRIEWGLDERAYDYLRLAQARSLGTFERANPWGNTYQQIEYLKIDL
jgi:hypothetical protein